MTIASMRLSLPSCFQALYRAFATGSNIDGRGSLHAPMVACLGEA